MSQSIPPGIGESRSEDNSQNPYFGREESRLEDLDAAAPELRDEESQRVNRKALLFLAAIVALIAVMGVLLWTKMRSDGADRPVKVREERPYVPAVPRDLRTSPRSQGAPMAVEKATPIPVTPLPAPPPPARMRANESIKRGPSLMERRMSSTADSIGGDGSDDPVAQAYAGLQANAGIPGNTDDDESEESEGDEVATLQQAPTTLASYLRKPDTLLLRGTYIRCVLETRIVTDVPGFTSCVITEPVYSVNGKRLLLPKGSKLSGTYSRGARGPRIAVIWDRITTPTGLDVSMSSPGVDNLGGAGHPGDYDAHWASRISSSLMISLLADTFKYAAAKEGPESSEITDSGYILTRPYESVTARTMENLANRALQESMSRPPTVTINQGTVLNVYVSKDVDFSVVLSR